MNSNSETWFMLVPHYLLEFWQIAYLMSASVFLSAKERDHNIHLRDRYFQDHMRQHNHILYILYKCIYMLSDSRKRPFVPWLLYVLKLFQLIFYWVVSVLKILKFSCILCQTCLNIWLRESDTQVFCFSVEYKFRPFLI